MSIKDTSNNSMISYSTTTLPIDTITELSTNKELFENYKAKYTDKLYSIIMYSLSHEEFNNKRAQMLWESILSHWKYLNSQLHRDVGISVATLDYLTNIKSILSDPILMEAEKSEFISEIATKDALTDLVSRDMFDYILERELNDSNRFNNPFCFALIDIDDFKTINDTHGHHVGNKVLAEIGRIIKSHTRKIDTAARYGGDEFALILTQTTMTSAKKVIERIQETISLYSMENLIVTISAGICQYDPQKHNMQSTEQLLKKADKALYQAKSNGKNRIITDRR